MVRENPCSSLQIRCVRRVLVTCMCPVLTFEVSIYFNQRCTRTTARVAMLTLIFSLRHLAALLDFQILYVPSTVQHPSASSFHTPHPPSSVSPRSHSARSVSAPLASERHAEPSPALGTRRAVPATKERPTPSPGTCGLVGFRVRSGGTARRSRGAGEVRTRRIKALCPRCRGFTHSNGCIHGSSRDDNVYMMFFCVRCFQLRPPTLRRTLG